ncbi:MAG: tetratricopeptide repeat protein [Bacteroidaceae bacterium]|nr:tetratricopeptide repeat protein [Bacteroidaceae bacterium]
MKNDYYDSDEFKEILDIYETSSASGTTPYLDADDYADVADYYLNCDQLDKCFESLESGLTHHPNSYPLLSIKSSAYIFLHKYKEAEKIILTLDPSHEETLYQKAQLQYALHRNTPKAEEMFADWIAISRESILSETDEEDEERAQEQLRDCYIHVITSFIELAPSRPYDEELVKRWIEDYIVTFSPLGHYDSDLILADTVREENLFDMIIRVYSQILQTDPYIRYGWTILAAAQFSCDLYDDAIESADFALAVNPEDHDARLTKAHSLYATNRFTEALPLFQQYIADTHDPSQSLPYAICLIAADRKADARKQLKKAEKYYARFRSDKEFYATSCFEMADAYLTLEHIPQAEHFIDIALRLCPHNIHYQLLKGTLLLIHGDIHGAITYFISYVEGNPDVIEATLQVVVRLIIFNLETIALQLIDTIEQLTPPISNIHRLYPYKALAYIRLNQYDKFLRYLKKSLETSPTLTHDVLADLFPEDMNPKDYYQYMIEKL